MKTCFSFKRINPCRHIYTHLVNQSASVDRYKQSIIPNPTQFSLHCTEYIVSEYTLCKVPNTCTLYRWFIPALQGGYCPGLSTDHECLPSHSELGSTAREEE